MAGNKPEGTCHNKYKCKRNIFTQSHDETSSANHVISKISLIDPDILLRRQIIHQALDLQEKDKEYDDQIGSLEDEPPR